jgi:hypothetical protein
VRYLMAKALAHRARSGSGFVPSFTLRRPQNSSARMLSTIAPFRSVTAENL